MNQRFVLCRSLPTADSIPEIGIQWESSSQGCRSALQRIRKRRRLTLDLVQKNGLGDLTTHAFRHTYRSTLISSRDLFEI